MDTWDPALARRVFQRVHESAQERPACPLEALRKVPGQWPAAAAKPKMPPGRTGSMPPGLVWALLLLVICK